MLRYLVEKTNAYAEKKLSTMTLTLQELETCDSGRDEGVHCHNPEHGDSAADKPEGLLEH